MIRAAPASAFLLSTPVTCAAARGEWLAVADGLLDELASLRRACGGNAGHAERIDWIIISLAAACGVTTRAEMVDWPGFPGWETLACVREGEGFDGLLALARALPAAARDPLVSPGLAAAA